MLGYDGGVLRLEEEGTERLWRGVKRGLEGTVWIQGRGWSGSLSASGTMHVYSLLSLVLWTMDT